MRIHNYPSATPDMQHFQHCTMSEMYLILAAKGLMTIARPNFCDKRVYV